MTSIFRKYAVQTMEAIRDGAMSGGLSDDVEIVETYMAPGQEEDGFGPVRFDFEGRHTDGTTVMGEVKFSSFDIEPGDCADCGAIVEDYGEKHCFICKEEGNK